MTTEVTVRDFIIHYYKNEYATRSKIIIGFSSHVEKIYADFIFSNTERSKHMKSINDLVGSLNTIYNNRMNSIVGTSDIDIDNSVDGETTKSEMKNEIKKIERLDENIENVIKMPMLNNKNITGKIKLDTIDNLFNLSFFRNEMKKMCPNDFISLDKKMRELACTFGAKSFYDILFIFTGCDKNMILSEYSESKQVLGILDNMFVPLYVVDKGTCNKSELRIYKPNMVPEKYEIMLENFYKIEIDVCMYGENNSLNVYGYFEADPISSYIRTSQISNRYIYDRRKYFSELIVTAKAKKINSVPTSFKDSYVRNLTVGDLLSYNDTSFTENLLSDYAIYQKYSSLNNFKALFAEFVQAKLLVKYKIIKFLLLSSNTSDAGLLFSLTKESKIGSSIISDIIYKNLSLQLQSKLHKANVTIKAEIEKISNLDPDDVDLKKQVISSKNMPQKVKKMALEKINEMKSGNSEYYKQLLFVKTLVDYPWTGDNDGDIFSVHKDDITKWEEIMTKTHDKLHSKVYGHNECKETIVELLGKWFSNPKSLGKAIGLWGPPGVGKTLIAKELGDALGIPCVKINLGGMEDGAVLSGHSITYSGAVPGLIVKRMVEAGKPRCIMFFDELDKACYHHGRNEIYDVLIHVIDPTTNAEFNDKFFQDICFPINKTLFMFSFNDKSKIDPILLDRMEIIKVDAYTPEDKINIVNKFILKDLKEDIGMSKTSIKISDENILYLVDSFTQEPGVRSIRRKIEKILLKINKEKIFKTGMFEKSRDINDIEITRDMIDKYLQKPTIVVKKVGFIPEIGTINGLYATSLGDGGIIPILIYKNQTGKTEKFGLKLTGKQGKVMQESVSFAFTIAINIIKEKYGRKFFENYPGGLHIHTPDGATTKDGPSAGSAFTVGFISRILDKRIKNDISMTGEIERDGCITAIGGLEYKLPGAKKAGVRLVFIPKENEQDLKKIKENNKTLFDENFKYIIVEHVRDILDLALIEDNYIYSQDATYQKLFNHKKYLIEVGEKISHNNNKNDKNDKNNSKNNLVSTEESENESNNDTSENEETEDSEDSEDSESSDMSK